MQTGGIKLRPALVMAAFALSCFGLLLFLWLSFGGPVPLKPKGYRVQAQFNEATTLATEADIRISGVPVGKVKKIEPDPKTGKSLVNMQIDAKYAPLPADVKATLRQKTLLGETYVELTPGTSSAKTIRENGTIPDSAISDSVQLDEIFRAFNPKTRNAFQTWMQEQSKAISPYAVNVNAALGNLGPFAEDASEVVGILDRQQKAVQGLISNTGVVFGALSERGDQLRTMITSLDTVFKTTSGRDQELREAITALPTFQREARTTLARLDRFANNANPLVTQLRPVARELSPTLRDLQGIAPDLKALFRDLGPLITASKTGFPATQRLLRDLKPFLQQAHPTLQQLDPILQYIGRDKRLITAFLGNVVAATQATASVGDRQVHYLRTANPLGPENLAAYPRRLGTNRPNPYMLPGGFDKLKQGLDSYETRQCGRGVPVVSQVIQPVLTSLLPTALLDQVNAFALPVTSSQNALAPPCRQQAKFDFQGKTGTYPVVSASP